MAALNPDGTSGGIIESPNDQGRKKKVIARRKAPTAVDIAQDDRATLDMELPGPRRRLGRPPKKQKTPREPKKRGEREDTPSGAEEEVVDPTTLTMSALCKDLRIGKKFSRHDDIKARVQKEKAESTARRSARDNSELAASTEEQEGDVSVVNANLEADAQAAAGGNADPSEAAVEEPDVAAPQGRSVMMRIVDGQIVVDERSVQIDRHREAQNAQDGPMEVVEENDFTRIITAGTYMKREKTSAWDWPAMDMFYKGLRTFGTDFGMIANMFPHRSRKQIKLRFNKEERENPELIARALSAPQIPINFEEYSKFSNKTFLETEEIHAEQQALKAEHEASLAAAESRNASANKKKKDAIRKNGVKDILDAVSDDEDDHAGGSSAKENRAPSAGAARSREASTAAGPGRRGGKKAAKPSRANKHSMRAGGEEVEVLGTVD
jgi:transcription factor TFIIIB component B''